MASDEIIKALIKENVPLAPLTTMRSGGNARLYAEPADEGELEALISYASDNDLEVFILGNGSNCLVSDKGFDGLVIRIGKNMGELETIKIPGDDDHLIISAGAGSMLSKFGNYCVEAGLEGAEFACGIPGSVGGAVFMNAGAYGGEIKDIAYEVTYYDGKSIRTIKSSECGFGYRTSLFENMAQEGKTAVITGFKARLAKGDKEQITNLVEDLRKRRTSSQPLDVPSAGSTFKRPEGHFAAKLIEDSGLKGFALDDSGAQVSPKHAGFVVNNGGKASSSDILRLIDYVSDKVYENSGVRLEKEVRLVGDFGG